MTETQRKFAALAFAILFTLWTILWIILGRGVGDFWPFGCWVSPFIGMCMYGLGKLFLKDFYHD